MNIEKPTKVPMPTKCKQIKAGSYHSYALTKQGIYSWGKSNNYNLGKQQTQQWINKPIFIQLQIDDISTCTSHTFAWKNNTVYCWGSNLNYQLGLEQDRYYQITKINLFQEAINVGLQFQEISCGQNHTIAIFKYQGNQSKLFAWGQSKSNQLTLDTTSTVPYPVLSQYELAIQRIYSKSQYNVALCSNGVYSWGSNLFGRLGVSNHVKIQRVPTHIQIPHKIVKIGIGVYHVLGITIDGQAYGWGHGLHGQLGIGKIISQITPTKINLKETIIDASCGEQHTLIHLKNGRLMSCGNNSNYVLGHNKIDSKKRSVRFEYIDDIQNVKEISSGYKHNIVLTEAGEVYTWGSNKFGQCGHVEIEVKDKHMERMPRQKSIQKSKTLSNDQIYTKLQNWKIKYNQFITKKQQQQKKLLEELEIILNQKKNK